MFEHRLHRMVAFMLTPDRITIMDRDPEAFLTAIVAWHYYKGHTFKNGALERAISDLGLSADPERVNDIALSMTFGVTETDPSKPTTKEEAVDSFYKAYPKYRNVYDIFEEAHHSQCPRPAPASAASPASPRPPPHETPLP